MRLWVKRAFVSHLVAAISLTMAGAVAAQGSLADARALYSSAAYDEALAMLNGLHASDQRPEDGGAIDQYRALCLLALGRTDEARHAIEAIVTASDAKRLCSSIEALDIGSTVIFFDITWSSSTRRTT